MDEKNYWLSFSAMSGVGPGAFKKLLVAFGSAQDAWNASDERLIEKAIRPALTKKLAQFKKTFEIEKYLERIEKAGIKVVLQIDEAYPELLKQIPNPPILLYVKGNEKILNGVRLFGIVGTRKITEYGRTVTEMFSSSLTLAGFTIVSGLALGVDAQAHLSCLESGGKTIAVLGCGVDCCTPPSNQFLYDRILEQNGAIVSEFPPSQIPTVGSFPSRNRIIAGMSQALLVTEGAEDSGSLITAECALKFGRRVFAIPGPVTSSLSRGPFKLVKQGATMVTEPAKILTKFQISNDKFQINTNKNSSSSKFKNMTKDEQKILKLLENESVHFDDLVKRSKFNSAKLGSLLSVMEVKGMIKSQDGGKFSLVSV